MLSRCLLCLAAAALLGGCSAARNSALPPVSVNGQQTAGQLARRGASIAQSVVPAYTDWSTFGFDVARSGYNPNETTLTPGNVSSLQLSWSVDLGAAIDAQAVVATNVAVKPHGNKSATAMTLVYVGTEGGTFYALGADTGQTIWHKSLGMQSTSCGDLPSGQFGITGTATFVRSTNRIYVADGLDRVHALDMSSGQEAAGWPVTVATTPSQDHMYGGLTYNAANQLLYAETASICDTSPWHGRIVAISTASASIVATFYPAGPYSGAGIWGMGGASIDTATNDVYVATGNDIVAPAPSQSSAYGDAVVQLNANLGVLAFNTAPISEPDQDFGATPILFQLPGCPAQVSAKNKDGVLFTWNRDSISSGPVQALQLANASSDGAFIGVPAYSPAADLLYVGNPNDFGNFSHGLVALQGQGACSGFTLGWKAAVGPSTTSNDNEAPTVANGVVYFTDGLGHQVFAFSAASGAMLWNSGATISGNVFAAPTADGRVYIGSWDHKLYAFGV